MGKEIFNVITKENIKDVSDYIEKQLQEQIIDNGIYKNAELQVNVEVIFHW